MVPEVARLQAILTFLNLGADRVLFGTDFPFGSPATYAPYVRGLRVNFLLRRLLGVARSYRRTSRRSWAAMHGGCSSWTKRRVTQ